MSVHENDRLKELQSKFRLKRLELERRAEILDVIWSEVGEHRHFHNEMARLKNKYGLKDGLEFERGYGARNELTVQEVVTRREDEAKSKLAFCFGSTEFMGKCVPMALLIRRR
jgi:hypothetical protein